MFLVNCWKQDAMLTYLDSGVNCIRIYENDIAEKQSYKYKKVWNLSFSNPNTQTLKHKILPSNEWK